MEHLIQTIFPFSLNELYKAVFLYLVLHRGHSVYKKVTKEIDTERRKIIRKHVKDSHKESLKTCIADDCATLVS